MQRTVLSSLSAMIFASTGVIDSRQLGLTRATPSSALPRQLGCLGRNPLQPGLGVDRGQRRAGYIQSDARSLGEA